MSQKQWEPLTAAEAVIEAIKAGRHVEFTACGCDYNLPGWKEHGSEGWVAFDDDEKTEILEGGKITTPNGQCRYRALIAPAQPAADVDPADAELADAIAKGTEAWAGVPEGWVDELRGGKAKPMNIIEEAKRLLHSEDHRGLHPEIHAFIRAVAGLEPVAYARAWHINGEVPAKSKNAAGRMHWPTKYKFHRVTPLKCMEDDRPLYILEPTND